jgi:hypothetical protein
MTKRLATVVAVCTLLAAGADSAGQSSAKTFYIFAGVKRTDGVPNDAEAKKLESFEQANAIAVADRVACALTRSVAVSGVLGIYDKASANSLLTKVNLEPAQMEYVGSLLGLYEHMKYVLVFSAQRGGQDRLWIIKTSRSLDSVAAVVREQHLTPLSVRIEKSVIQIWIVDLGDKFGQQPKDLATQLGGTASSEDGTSEIVGDQMDRVKAEAAYQSAIQAFEQHSKLRFSSSVTSEAWQKASTRTCSVELPE